MNDTSKIMKISIGLSQKWNILAFQCLLLHSLSNNGTIRWRPTLPIDLHFLHKWDKDLLLCQNIFKLWKRKDFVNRLHWLIILTSKRKMTVPKVTISITIAWIMVYSVEVDGFGSTDLLFVAAKEVRCQCYDFHSFVPLCFIFLWGTSES